MSGHDDGDSGRLAGVRVSKRVFVIRDFEIKGIDISLEDLRRAPLRVTRKSSFPDCRVGAPRARSSMTRSAGS
jgi:hypothetical protein